MLLDRQAVLLNPRLTVIFSCGFALLLFAIYHITVYKEHGPALSVGAGGNHHGASEQHSKPDAPPSLEETIRQLFSHIKHPDFTSKFTDPTGTDYTHNISTWTQPLGKDLLIVDVDTRYPESMFDPHKQVDWEHLDTNNLVTEAVFNHYLYATIHGYDYRYYRPESVEGHHKTWPKVHSMFNLLPDYKFVVFLDADASFRHLHLPFEWLLNRWNVTERTSFTMARDPLDADCNLCDSNGIAMVNTGFVVVQNLEYTNEIFDVWMKCTSEETKYQGCDKWKMQWAHEQAVFSDYLRYDYNPDGDNIRELECGEANGFPGHMWYDPVDCNGKFIRHHTFVKDMTKTTTGNSVMQAFVDIMKTNFAGPAKDVVVSEKEQKKKVAPPPQTEAKEGEGERKEEQKKEDEPKKDDEKEGEKKNEKRIIHEPVKRR